MSNTVTGNFITQHPKALWPLALSYSVVIYSFVAINTLIVLYAIQQLHFSTTKAYILFAAFNALLFTLSLPGGYISGRFGHKYTAAIGLIFCVLSLAIISVGHDKATYYVGLSAYIVGYGFCTPAFFCLVDLTYAKDDKRRDSGYTIFYLLFNVGSIAAAISEGYVATYVGYQYAFLIASCVLLIGLLIFCLSLSLRMIKPHPSRNMKAPVSMRSGVAIITKLMAIGVALTFPLIFLLNHAKLSEALLWALVIGSCIGVLILAFKQRHLLAKWKLIVFIFLCVASIGFWALYMLESSLMIVFVKYNIDRVVFGSTIPASSFYGLDPLGVIVIGLFFSWLWLFLAKYKRVPSLPTKFALALIAMGVGYEIFALGTQTVSSQYLVSPLWIVLGYVFLTSAELLIAPIGLSMVGRLAPAGKEGVLMGIWNLFIGFSAVVSGYLAEMTTTKSTLPRLTNPVYAHTFVFIGVISIVIGALLFLFVPTLKRLLRGKVKGS